MWAAHSWEPLHGRRVACWYSCLSGIRGRFMVNMHQSVVWEGLCWGLEGGASGSAVWCPSHPTPLRANSSLDSFSTTYSTSTISEKCQIQINPNWFLFSMRFCHCNSATIELRHHTNGFETRSTRELQLIGDRLYYDLKVLDMDLP